MGLAVGDSLASRLESRKFIYLRAALTMNVLTPELLTSV